MFRALTVILLTLGLPFSALAQVVPPANEVSIVALVITSGTETPVSDSVTEALKSLDAQTLIANEPNASEMRSILKRFTAAAIDTDVALVYFDGAVLKFGDRDFVAPGGIDLRRPTDLLTKAIPLSALARATALAGNGGAVIVHASGQNISLIDGISEAQSAPAPRPGTSPVLFADETGAVHIATGLLALSETEGDIDLTETLGALSMLEGVTISQLPTRAVALRTAPAPAPVEETTATEETAGSPEGTAATDDGAGGLALPQVGDSPETTAAPDSETASPVIAETPDSGDNATPTETNGTDLATPEPVVQEPEFSLDVLRAMQGAISRSQKKVIQHNLSDLGYYRGLIDGQFGPQTRAAISAYQASISTDETGVLTPSQVEDLSD